MSEILLKVMYTVETIAIKLPALLLLKKSPFLKDSKVPVLQRHALWTIEEVVSVRVRNAEKAGVFL